MAKYLEPSARAMGCCGKGCVHANGAIMTRRANRLSSFLIPAVLLFAGTAMAMPPSAQGKMTTNDQAGSSLPQLAASEVVIRGGCPYNLDKICQRNKAGKVVHCRCAS
jgi:hypothetical protein